MPSQKSANPAAGGIVAAPRRNVIFVSFCSVVMVPVFSSFWEDGAVWAGFQCGRIFFAFSLSGTDDRNRGHLNSVIYNTTSLTKGLSPHDLERLGKFDIAISL